MFSDGKGKHFCQKKSGKNLLSEKKELYLHKTFLKTKFKYDTNNAGAKNRHTFLRKI